MIETTIRRVATYARVSSDDQRERETIKTQTDALDRRLASEPNIEIFGSYRDDGISGSLRLADRPAGARLLADAEAGRFQILYVYRLDRLGRDLVDLAIVGRRLRQLGIRLISLTEGEPDPFMFDIQAAIAENEKRVFLKRSADGMQRAAREGRYCGGIVAFGYIVEGSREHAHLVPDTAILWADQSAADIVHWIYERLGLDRWSCRRIASELNARGVPTHYTRDARLVKRDNRRERTQGLWRSGRIRNLVTNPLYRGAQPYGRRSSNEREVITAPVEGLVPPALWHAAHDTLAANRLIAKNTHRHYLLRGAIRCGICGLTYLGSRGRGNIGWYRCGGQLVERGPIEGRCWGRSIRTDAIEALVWADVERWLRDPGEALEDLDGHVEREAQAAVAVAESVTLASAMADLDGQRARALDSRVRGKMRPDEFDAVLERIADERAILEARVAALEPPRAPDVAEIAPDLLAELRARLDAGLTDEQRQEIVGLLIRVVVHTETTGDGRRKTARATVEYRFPAVVETSTDRGSSPRRT